jgi:hypothetical protein
MSSVNAPKPCDVRPRDIYIIRDSKAINTRVVVYGEEIRSKCAPHVAKALESVPYNGQSTPTHIGSLIVTKTQTMG